jgi:hypothetical protein
MLLYPLLCTVALAVQDSLPPAARRILDDIGYLSADERSGRGLGSDGLAAAGEYIARAFRIARLQAPFPDSSYFQPFTISPDAPAVMHIQLSQASSRNVVGFIAGTSPSLRGQVVVVGAHYDHLGLGGFGSLAPDSTGRVHNGADDNASGTAVLIEIGRRLAARLPARTIVLVAFSGEELGLLGSTHFVLIAVPQPAESIYAMINLDMVGRLRAERLLALGAESAREFPDLLDSLNYAPSGSEPRFDLRASGDGWGPSDHSAFYAAGVPVLHFFTDLHEDYHRPTDDWEKINAVGAAEVAEFVSGVTLALANRPDSLSYVRVPRPQINGQGYGAYLGTIPDMTQSPGGVLLTGVREGSPAQEAGLEGGDIITSIGGTPIANLMDMTKVLRAHQAGDTVEIIARRKEETLHLTAVLGSR